MNMKYRYTNDSDLVSTYEGTAVVIKSRDFLKKSKDNACFSEIYGYNLHCCRRQETRQFAWAKAGLILQPASRALFADSPVMTVSDEFECGSGSFLGTA